MILRSVLLLLTLAAASPAAAACTGPNLIEAMPAAERAALSAAVEEHAYPEGNLWRAEKDGQTLHVQGTVHVPDPRLDAVVDRLRPILAETDLLILETTSASHAEMERIITERPEIAFLTQGPTLIDLLGDDLWSGLADDLDARGIPPFLGAKFRPWLLSITLAIPNCAFAALQAGETGLDGRLEALARSNGLPIATLDDIQDILDLLSGGDLDAEVDMLRLTLAMEQDGAAAMATTLDSYFAGRHRELWEFSRVLAAEAGLDPAAFDRLEADLLDGRNIDWAAKLPGLVGDSDAVIAVGAAHLSGETGLLRSLESLGYAITRL